MQIGQIYKCKGFVTQEKYLLGQSLVELEKRLGFKIGRFADGVWIGKLLTLPQPNEFDLQGYSQVAVHKHQPIVGLDINILKRNALGVMKTEGLDRLIKVFPVIGHNTGMGLNEQYPPGSGVPQWNLNIPLPFLITHFVGLYPSGIYSR